MKRVVLLTALIAAPLAALGQVSLAVDVTNVSEPVLCAEKDNVTINFASDKVRRFSVEALHPAYIGMLREDRFAPDFTACPQDLSPATTEVKPPRRVTFYEDVETWLTGYTFTNYWRPHGVSFRVGDRAERGLHVVQLWVRRNERAEEVLAVYPGDGYWRIRPLPPAHLGWSAYGSSILIGPVETEGGRPIVKLASIDFDPATMAFQVTFEGGGKAKIAIDKLDRDRLRLDVTFDRSAAGTPFAALRSMYVTEFNADVARIAVRDESTKSWREEPIMAFRGASTMEVWAGRLVPSRHNTSAPDIVFNNFQAAFVHP